MVDLGIDMVRFGPVAAAVVTEEAASPRSTSSSAPPRPARSRTATCPPRVQWMERHDVDFRVLRHRGLPEQRGGRAWLRRSPATGCLDGPAQAGPRRLAARLRRAARDRHLRARRPAGKTKASAIRWPRASASPTGRRPSSSTCPARPGWRCYCAVDGDEPLAYSAMHIARQASPCWRSPRARSGSATARPAGRPAPLHHRRRGRGLHDDRGRRGRPASPPSPIARASSAPASSDAFADLHVAAARSRTDVTDGPSFAGHLHRKT